MTEGAERSTNKVAGANPVAPADLGGAKLYTDLSYKLSAAVHAYKDRMVRGLNALTDAEINARIAEFRANYAPCRETGTQEEWDAFSERLWAFKQSLFAIQQAEEPESLITTSSQNCEDGEEEDDVRPTPIPQAQVYGNAEMLGQEPRRITDGGLVAGLYESKLLNSQNDWNS
ncbi:MAG: hypothetical protein FWB98_07600 [Defluviitaleaceae bacterium]|nr:hypothetical protein [Defluviitaleaceae bacterium]